TAKKTAKKKGRRHRRLSLRGQIRAEEKLAAAHRDVFLELARIQAARGAYGAAVRHAEEALALARGAQIEARVALLEVVNNLYYVGDYRRVLSLADEGLALSGRSPRRRLQFLNAKGVTLSRMGQAEPALVALREALKLARGTHRLGEIAASHNNIGDALRTAGRFEEARVAFAEALRLDRGRGNSVGRSFDLANLGLTDALLGLRARARQELNEAKALAQEIGAPLNRLKALAGLARLDLAANRLAKARDHAAVGLALSRRLGLRTWLWRFLLLSGHAARAEGKLDLALRHFKEGVAIVDALPPRALLAAGMPKIQGQPSDLDDELIELLARRGQAEASFVLAERARLRRLVDRVSRNVSRLPEAAARQELAALVSLAADVEALRGARLRAKTAKARQGIDRELEAIEGRREARRRKLAALNPRLVSLVEAHAAPLAALRRALPAKTALVAFYPGPRGVITWVLDPQGLKVHVADLPRPQLVTLVQHFREALTTFQPVKRPARRLYDLLLGTLAPALRGRSQLVVVSSGILL
ncbi:MAG: tetratricopeptide repeat protein, partial [Deltaproteobacteria bacterium]|nr:tetratricopeptide repeat protein [Deltaproteobacteria bacterium]